MDSSWVVIEDPADPRLSDYLSLTDAPGRQAVERSGAFFVCEGALLVERLFRSQLAIRSVVAVAEQASRLGVPAGVDAYVVGRDVVAELVGFDFHRGVLASAARPRSVPLTDLVGPLVAVEGVADHENLGAIFRSAAALGAGGVVMDPSTTDPFYRRCVRVSMGAVFALPVARCVAWPEDLRFVAGGWLVALSPTGATAIGDVAVPAGRTPVLMVGSEGAGLSNAALDAADTVVHIPMVPGHDSLNVGHALAIAAHRLFEI